MKILGEKKESPLLAKFSTMSLISNIKKKSGILEQSTRTLKRQGIPWVGKEERVKEGVCLIEDAGAVEPLKVEPLNSRDGPTIAVG